MSNDHLGNMERSVRPALALGLFAMHPFLALGAAACLAFIVLSSAYGAAMVPFAASDEAMDDLLMNHFPAGKVALGTAVLGVLGLVGYAALMLVRGRWHGLLLPKAAAIALLGYAGAVTAGSLAHGTHPWGQLSYSWSSPKRSALLAWGCPASVSGGQAERSGRYNLSACETYVDKATLVSACRQVMRHMATLTGPQAVCFGPIRTMTGHWWPTEFLEYKAVDTSWRQPVENPPLATPDRMRALLAEQGLTPL